MKHRLQKHGIRASVAATLFTVGASSQAAPVPHAVRMVQAATPFTSMFHPPKFILAPTIAGDSPASPWYFPTKPVRVIRQISAWLRTAKPTDAHIPKTNQNLVFNAYIGPAQLHFSDGSGTSLTVEPAFYIGRNSRGYHPVLIPNIIAYQQGGHVQYLRNPKLYHWLADDTAWQSQFRQESWTNQDKTAIRDAKASGWGTTGLNLFPATPGINRQALPMGGPLTRSHPSVPGTVESLVDGMGNSRQVTFMEIWNNGWDSHRWTFVVSPNGRILKHTQSGDLPPQDQK